MLTDARLAEIRGNLLGCTMMSSSAMVEAIRDLLMEVDSMRSRELNEITRLRAEVADLNAELNSRNQHACDELDRLRAENAAFAAALELCEECCRCVECEGDVTSCTYHATALDPLCAAALERARLAQAVVDAARKMAATEDRKQTSWPARAASPPASCVRRRARRSAASASPTTTAAGAWSLPARSMACS